MTQCNREDFAVTSAVGGLDLAAFQIVWQLLVVCGTSATIYRLVKRIEYKGEVSTWKKEKERIN